MTISTLFSRNHTTLLLITKRRSTDATGGFLLKISQYSQEKASVFEEHLRTVVSEETLGSD